MSELNHRLATLVEQRTPGRVPPFAEVRRTARRRSRRRTATGAVAFALVLVVVGAVTVPVLRARTDRPDRAPVAALPVDGPAPQRITQGGREFDLTGESPMREVWIDPRNRSTLVVEAGGGMADLSGPCASVTVVRVVAQDERTVTIGAFLYQPPDRAGGTCPDRPGWTARHVLALGAPVDGRTVLRGSVPVPVRDPAGMLLPTFLPAGYRQPGLLSWGFPAAMPEPAVPGRTAQWTFESADAAAGTFRLVQADPDAERAMVAANAEFPFDPEDTLAVEAHPTVRGHAGLVFTRGPLARCLRWRESPTLAVSVCHYRSGGPLPAADLVAVAEGLRGP